MAGNDPVDQDAIAAQWEASLDSEDPAQAAEAAAANELSGTMALQWAAMVEDTAATSAARTAANGYCHRRKSTTCSASPSATSTSTTIPAFAPSSIRRWSPTSVCRCSKSYLTGWCA